MNVDDLVSTARDSVTVKRVFGEPLHHDGITVIPAAAVLGGAGGGGGHDDQGQEGEGGGFGLRARPAGAYVIRGGQVTWQAAIDVNRLVTAAATVAVVYMVTRVRMAKIRARQR